MAAVAHSVGRVPG